MILVNGPFSLIQLKQMNSSKSMKSRGIYVWGASFNNIFYPLYVGKANNIHERLFQHTVGWKGGIYRVPEWSDILSNNKGGISFTLNKNLLYIPRGLSTLDYFNNDKKVQQTMNNVYNGLFFCWLEMNEKDLGPYESHLAELIGKGRLISSHKIKSLIDSRVDQFYNTIFKI
jgi:hypothetical protein